MSTEPLLASLQEQLHELQTQVSFQENTIEELNAALQMQQQDLDRLKRHWDVLRSQYSQLPAQVAASEGAGEEPPPPHY